MFTEEVAAIIVSYNPDMEVFRQLLSSIKKQCHAVVIDNGSSAEHIRVLEDMLVDHENTDLLLFPENMGIARAQNIAIKRAVKNYPSVSKVLLLDHDSIPSDNMVTCLETTFETVEEQGNSVAAIGPVLYDPRDDNFLKFQKMKLFFPGKIDPEKITSQQPVVEVDGLNSSGTLISIKAFRSIGEFDSKLFIDHVETDWCFRAKEKGFKLFATTGTKLTHYMGDDICYYWLFGKKCMPYRSPSRHYYLARNSILLQKRNYIPAAWKASNILKLCFTYLYFGFFCEDRKQQRRCILQGIRDGMKGITGKTALKVQE